MRYALLLLVLAACRFGFDHLGDDATGDGGSDAGEAPPFEKYWRNGSRLRAVTLAPVDGGDPVLVGWFDTMLNTACRNAVAADGMERCVPAEINADTYYSDAACTQPLAIASASLCMTTNQYASGRDAMSRSHVYAIGAPFTGQIYDIRTGCMPASASPIETVYNIGAELPPAMLLQGQYHNETIGSFVRPFQGAIDGSSSEIGSLVIMGVPCYPHANGLGPARCQPTQARGEPVYSDNQCTQRAYFWNRLSYESSSAANLVVFDAQACETQYKLVQTTADLTAQGSFYRLSPSGCTQVNLTVDQRLYTATEINDPRPLGTIVPGPRRGRLGWLYWIGPDGAGMVQRYYDHDLKTVCNPFVAADGKLRCLPEPAAVFTGSPDAACGSSRSLVTSCFGGTPLDGPSYRSCIINSSGGNVYAVPKLGDVSSTFVETTCTSLDTPGGVYDPNPSGTPLPSTMFAEMMEVVE